MRYGAQTLRPTLCDMETLGGGWEAIPMAFEADRQCTVQPRTGNQGGCVSRSIRQGTAMSTTLEAADMVGGQTYGPVGEFMGLEMDCRSVNAGRYTCPTLQNRYINATGVVGANPRGVTRVLSGQSYFEGDDSLDTPRTLDGPLDAMTALAIGLIYYCEPPEGQNSANDLSDLEVECRLRALGGPGGGYLLTRPICLIDEHCSDEDVCMGQVCVRPPENPVKNDGGAGDHDAGTP